jgi:hypothetical protein
MTNADIQQEKCYLLKYRESQIESSSFSIL